jgi:IS6 family transposase
LSLRDVEELLEERCLEADHTTVWRWVQRYGPELEQRLRRHPKHAIKSWRVDETYVRCQGPLALSVSGHRFGRSDDRFLIVGQA